jgi:histidinol dehydrogenase
LYAQEAKRQCFGQVGIDGFAGPSDLLIIASDGADPSLVAADAAAQAEHGEGTIVAVVHVGSDPWRTEVGQGGSDPWWPEVAKPGRGHQGSDPQWPTVAAEDVEAALALAEAFAPEHLQLMGPAAEALAPRVRNAGCVFVGNASGTAFGDYVAGSNHVLPTEGAARFASGLNTRHFTRVMAEVRLGDAAGELAPAGAAIARAEGFEQHARSMEARLNGG